MVDSRTPPHDLDAEAAILGALLLRPNLTADINQLITETDFYRPDHAATYHAITSLHNHGQPIDAVTVRDQLRRDGAQTNPALLNDLIAAAGVPADKYARIVADHSTRRRLIAAAAEISQAAYEGATDAAGCLDLAHETIGGIDLPGDMLPPGVWTLDEFMARPPEQRAPWVVEGLVRAGWRVVLVAAEGVGKSMLFRAVALAAAQGLHPFHFTEIPPVRTLIVDLENPDDAIVDTCVPIRDKVRDTVPYEEGRAWLWHRPGGINLRSRADKGAFEAVLTHTRPDLVCLGPLYKAYRVQARENDELAAAEVQSALDDLRTRHNFALLMEHHAPKPQHGVRDLLPYGSSLWLRWPEIGLKLLPEDESLERVQVGRWRGDRLQNGWPRVLVRGRDWPWLAGES